MPSARLGARGLGGKKTELTANRSHAALPEYGPALRRALDHKLAKLRHDVKKILLLPPAITRPPPARSFESIFHTEPIERFYLSLSPASVFGLTVLAARTFWALVSAALWRMGFGLDLPLTLSGVAGGLASAPS